MIPLTLQKAQTKNQQLAGLDFVLFRMFQSEHYANL